MSVHYEHVVLYGYEFPYGTFEQELGWAKREELLYDDKEVGELGLVSDGMSGEYELFGVLLYKSGSNRSAEATIPLMNIPPRPDSVKMEQLTNKLMDLGLVGEASHSAGNYVLTHHR